MGSWPLVPLRDVLTLAADVHRVDPTEFYPIAGVYGFGRGIICRPSISGLEIEADRLYRVRAGQFIYSRLKSFEGAFAIVPEEASGFFVSNEFPTFDVAQDRLLPGFLRWWFQIPAVWQALAGEGRGIGARRERLHPEQLLARCLLLPPLGVQRVIVARLDAAAEGITRRQSLMTEVGRELAGLLASAFDTLVKSAPRAAVGDIAPFVRRPVTTSARERYSELGVRSFGRGLFDKPDLIGANLTWQKLFRIEAGDLVISNIKAWEGAFSIAGAEHHAKVGSHRYLTCVADQTRVLATFLWFYLQSPEGLRQVQVASPGSADRNRTLSQRGFELIQVPLPSIEQQEWFTRLHAKVVATRRTHADVGRQLARLTPALLEQAFGPIGDQTPVAT